MSSSSSDSSEEESETTCSSLVADTVTRMITHKWTFKKSAREGFSIWDSMFSLNQVQQELKPLETPIFAAEGHQWQLILRPLGPYRQIPDRQGTSVTCTEKIEIELKRLPSKTKDSDLTDLWIMLNFKFQAGVRNGHDTLSFQSPFLANITKKRAKYPFHIRQKDGGLCEKMGIKKNKLTIITQMTIVRRHGDVWHKIKVPMDTLGEDLKEAVDFEEGMTGQDVAIIAEGGVTQGSGEKALPSVSKFGAHKFILAARSPVFARMFKHEELSENKLNEVHIKDIEPDVLEEVLRFLYTGEVSNLQEMAVPLLYAADKYELYRLKALCERQLALDLEVENAANFLIIASQSNALQLKKFVLKFISFNGREVMKTKEWECVREAGLDYEVLCTVFDNQPEIGPPLSKKAKMIPS